MQKFLSGVLLASTVWTWNTFEQYFSTPRFPEFALETHVSQKRNHNSPFFQPGVSHPQYQVINKQRFPHQTVQYLVSKQTKRPIHSHHPISVFVQSSPIQTNRQGKYSGHRVQKETVYYYNRWGKVISIQHNTYTQGYGVYEKRLEDETLG